MTKRSSTPPRSRSSRMVRKPDLQERPTQLPLTGLLSIAAVSALAVLLGYAHVRTEFGRRDNEIETRRVQELTTLRRDEIKRLEARLGGLKRDENLRGAAILALGFIEPPASVVGELQIQPTREAAVRAASARARRNLDNKRREESTLRREEN